MNRKFSKLKANMQHTVKSKAQETTISLKTVKQTKKKPEISQRKTKYCSICGIKKEKLKDLWLSEVGGREIGGKWSKDTNFQL